MAGSTDVDIRDRLGWGTSPDQHEKIRRLWIEQVYVGPIESG